MDDLVQWYGEQLDEDERIAREAGGAAWEELPVSGWVHTSPLPASEWQPPGYDHHVASVPLPVDRVHIVQWDPARVLREIDANRRRLERHAPQPMVGRDSDENDPSTYVLGCPTCQVDVVSEGDWPCEEVRDMLISYADRPGYREEWRP
ncbi:DUF6221 family protein [Streptomyces sp. NPDC020607]|uniref:DUF6221 family protein n=1 Tax=Streptomyces sp. NPDC020607 TaxID=3365082 RepID=UPI0037ACCE8D